MRSRWRAAALWLATRYPQLSVLRPGELCLWTLLSWVIVPCIAYFRVTSPADIPSPHALTTLWELPCLVVALRWVVLQWRYRPTLPVTRPAAWFWSPGVSALVIAILSGSVFAVDLATNMAIRETVPRGELRRDFETLGTDPQEAYYEERMCAVLATQDAPRVDAAWRVLRKYDPSLVRGDLRRIGCERLIRVADATEASIYHSGEVEALERMRWVQHAHSHPPTNDPEIQINLAFLCGLLGAIAALAGFLEARAAAIVGAGLVVTTILLTMATELVESTRPWFLLICWGIYVPIIVGSLVAIRRGVARGFSWDAVVAFAALAPSWFIATQALMYRGPFSLNFRGPDGARDYVLGAEAIWIAGTILLWPIFRRYRACPATR